MPPTRKVTETLACPKCGCTWMNTVKVARYSNQQVQIGIMPLMVSEEYPMLCCVACGNAMIPPQESFMGSRSQDAYYNDLKQEITRCNANVELNGKVVQTQPQFLTTAATKDIQ